jgi:MFS family permease
MEFAVIWIGGAILGAILNGVIASNKGRNVAGWVALSVLLTPLVVLILLALRSLKVQVPTEVRVAPTGPVKICPDCAEQVAAAARICRYCRHEFKPALPSDGTRAAELLAGKPIKLS